ncbi:MFS transporter [Brotonthovivens ammoniilytica]|uniref:MFS transporter n=1 Tax=Brotonthovivens ammoniilytica TaxID=2981725 RepID=A0ABT2TL76_9FIRM|nr:MFS transporter [Brotonthovivens ammoniilytica]MCU6762299.1 MFS transporter [Brotonthovivens ammoniilytica]
MKGIGEVMDKKNNHSLFDFGKAGWGTIIFCMAMFWFFVGFCTDGNNVTAPAVAAHLGIQPGTVLQMNSYGGMIGVVFYIAMGQLTRKIGARKVSGISLFISAAAYIVIGNCPNLAVYTIAYVCLIGSIMSAGYVVGGALVAQWFPKRKGVVMGYTTMGLNIASATWVPMMTFIVNKMGFEKGVIIPAVLVAVLAVIGLVFMRNTPQERGINPDCVSDEVYKAEYDQDDAEHDTRWTVKKLLKTRAVWTVALATGILQCCSTGVMSQLVVRNQELGMSATQAVSMMTIIAVVGIFGSWLIGVFDDKFGTKKVMIIFCIWYAAAILANVTDTRWGMYLAVFMIGISIGGSANFMTSFPSSVFGRHGFEKVNSVIFPIQSIVTASAFLIDGISLNVTGSLRWSYLVLAIIGLIDIIFVGLTKDHEFNLDWKKQSV